MTAESDTFEARMGLLKPQNVVAPAEEMNGTCKTIEDMDRAACYGRLWEAGPEIKRCGDLGRKVAKIT